MIRKLIPLALLLPLASCGPSNDGNTLQGYVEGDYLRIAAPEAAWIGEVPLTEGTVVKKGQRLFTLDDTAAVAALAEAKAGLAQAEAALADRRLGARAEEIKGFEAQRREADAALKLARQDLDRQKSLAAESVAARARLEQAQATASQAAARLEQVTAQLATARLPARPDQLAAAEATVEAARASVAQAEWRLSQRHIDSPADALVDDIVRRPGEWAPAGGVVVSLLPPDHVKLVLFVPQTRRAGLAPGAKLAVTCDGCKPGLTAQVTRIASDAEYTPPVIYSRETRAKLVYRVEAALTPDPAALHPGQPVSAEPAP
ncbi:HlyD family secretion protein [Niveispirillum sp. KHB5.9]|uniref:HlyD family secretion protein n=1 Tax=Niveispirillum sp. KHB5.9 TaxID=3400269 RepID=UPI003A8AF970